MSRLKLSRCAALLALVPVLAAQSGSPSNEVHTATEIRLLDPGWWPTKGTPARDEYVGSDACAKCHADKAQTQKSTAMEHALVSASIAVPQQVSRGPLGFRIGAYSYEVAQTAAGPSYSVNSGGQSVSVPLSWVFGSGEFGQTYMFKQDGLFYESRVSYYTAPRLLDFTTGSPKSAPGKLDAALGRRMYPEEAGLCFGCHSTAATTNNHFEPDRLIPGVTCEACHGPGAQHVAAMNLGQSDQTNSFIMNPARLGPVESVEFCGACHRTSVDTSLSGVTGIFTLRFPVYRMERSRCARIADARLTCVACHDPHKPLVRDAASYDDRCLSCHIAVGATKPHRDHPGMACRAGRTTLCTTCHMPKVNVPEMHTTFTDHQIGIHREGSAFAP